MISARHSVVAALLAACAGMPALAQEWTRLPGRYEPVRLHVDLRDEGALEALQRSNPGHFGQIRRVLVRMRQAPSAGPQHWFPKHVRATDLEFSELSMKPAYPPRQRMRFTLDNVRYTLDVPVVVESPWSLPRAPRSYRMQSLH